MSRFDPKLPFPLPDANQDARPFPVVAPLSSTLVELNGWWLDVSCDCGHTRSSCLPFRLMAATYGWDMHLVLDTRSGLQDVEQTIERFEASKPR